ncbi:uncharacterized protein LOC18449003 isoform X1 [Amborella trichopoda]|uniref:uncharacterized protein LOC18449003 isoform X1 n=1 Tax=Amborella trichopoda TaxID=13333 RepID=UPI0005D45232|nr:uncharacterized protein LOC18449003 isoform X1 [Amborella trichopoda]|eukprot:XP_011628863.1 uncharacterized protein LOC18449003 isoform X1 [Amborella trichopoda]
MAKSSFSLLIIFSLFFLSLNPVKADSVHELLQSKGLPAGLLPKDVKSYSLEDDGRLEVHLDQPCYAKFDGMVYYDRVVRGNLSYGELTGVAGFSQEELFLWLPVKGIKVRNPDSGVILFDIGVVHKQLSFSLFEDPPDCRPEVKQSLRLISNDLLGKIDKNQEEYTSIKAG